MKEIGSFWQQLRRRREKPQNQNFSAFEKLWLLDRNLSPEAIHILTQLKDWAETIVDESKALRLEKRLDGYELQLLNILIQEVEFANILNRKPQTRQDLVEEVQNCLSQQKEMVVTSETNQIGLDTSYLETFVLMMEWHLEIGELAAILTQRELFYTKASKKIVNIRERRLILERQKTKINILSVPPKPGGE